MNNVISNSKRRLAFRALSMVFLLASFATMMAPSFNDHEENVLLNIPFSGIAVNLNLFNLQTIFMVLGWICLTLGIDRDIQVQEREIIQLNLNDETYGNP